MKKLFSIFAIALFSFSMAQFQRVEPAFWWKGTKNPELQILLYGKNADYEKNPQAYHIYKKVVTNGSKIKIHLARSGGYAISLKPIK